MTEENIVVWSGMMATMRGADTIPLVALPGDFDGPISESEFSALDNECSQDERDVYWLIREAGRVRDVEQINDLSSDLIAPWEAKPAVEKLLGLRLIRQRTMKMGNGWSIQWWEGSPIRLDMSDLPPVQWYDERLLSPDERAITRMLRRARPTLTRERLARLCGMAPDRVARALHALKQCEIVDRGRAGTWWMIAYAKAGSDA